MDSTASTPGSGGRRTTYREFDERVNRLASALAAVGVGRGDRVAFLAPNIPAMLEAHYGVSAAYLNSLVEALQAHLRPESVHL